MLPAHQPAMVAIVSPGCLVRDGDEVYAHLVSGERLVRVVYPVTGGFVLEPYNRAYTARTMLTTTTIHLSDSRLDRPVVGIDLQRDERLALQMRRPTPHPRHEQQPRNHRINPPPLEGDLVGLNASPAPPWPVAGGEHGGQVRDPERSRLAATAGMDPTPTASTASSTRLPRTRGDGPGADDPDRRLLRASPHTRGWTLIARNVTTAEIGFPAHAGMDPQAAPGAASEDRLPRTRGDGPAAQRLNAAPKQASPHTRGWTQLKPALWNPRVGFPAHAGMDRGRRRRASAT